MKQAISTVLFVVLFAVVIAVILISARTTIQFAAQLNRQPGISSLRAKPTPIAKPTPAATGALGSRRDRLPS